MAKKGIYQRYECVQAGSHGELVRRAWNSPSTIYKQNKKWLISELVVYEGNPPSIGYNYQNATSNYAFSMSIGTIFNNYDAMSPNPTYGVSEFYVLEQLAGQDTLVQSRGVFAENVIDYSRGTYLTDIIADYGSLPTNGRHTDGYWYVFVKMASDLKGNVSGIWRDTPEGWSNVNGIWKPQSELKCNINGIYK